MDSNQSLDYHLREALLHIEKAVNHSIEGVNSKQLSSQQVGKKWEVFIGQFLNHVRVKGKENRLNLFSWINFSKVYKSN